MSKEEQFETFSKQFKEYYGNDLEAVTSLFEIIQKSFYSGYAAGYAESVNEIAQFVQNQIATFNMEFSQQTQK